MSEEGARARRLVEGLNRDIRDGEGTSSLMERFDLLSGLIVLKVMDERLGCQAFRDPAPAPALRALASRIAADDTGLFAWRTLPIPVSDATLSACAARLARIDLLSVGDDLAGLAYEELLRRTFDKGDNQQFFTPRNVVDFMLGLVSDRLAGRVCDPACGTGGFLVRALAMLRDRGLGAHLVGMEVDERLARATRANLVLCAADDAKVRHLPGSGSLAQGAVELSGGDFDVVITNPPFGSDTTDRATLDDFVLGRGRASRRRGVLFVERCLDLLRPGGVACMVVDESITSGRAQADVRTLILERAAMLAVVALPETAFMPYASVRTSILLFERKSGPGKGPETFFARAGQVGRRPSGESHPEDDLPGILRAHRAHVGAMSTGEPCGQAEWFTARTEGAGSDARLDIAAHHPDRLRVAKLLESSRHPVLTLSSICERRYEPVRPDRDIDGLTFTHVGLSDMEPHTGLMRPVQVARHSVKGPVLRYMPGDVIMSRLRPELRKVCFVPLDQPAGHVSPECVVLVSRTDDAGRPVLLPGLLAELLRSDVTMDQVRHIVTGIGRPRLGTAALMSLSLPVPPPDEQARMLADLHEALAMARKLQDRARLALEEARRREKEGRDALLLDAFGVR